MSFDALLKKFFPAVVVVLIGLMALFQALGVRELLAAVIASQEAPAAGDADAPTRLARAPRREKKSADPLLERNPFDPITGSLLGSAVEIPAFEGRDELDPNQDPLQAPKCGDTEVRIVTESSDPEWSVAAIVGPGESDAKLRRVGDQVGDKEVAYIGYNWAKSSPAVWFADSSQLCQALLFDPDAADQPRRPKKKKKSKSKRKKRKSSRAVPDDIKAGINKISDSEIHVERAVVDKILAPENQTLLMRSVRISPEQKDGKVLGVRLHGVRSDSLLGVLGLKSGDVLQSINGFEMGSPEKALEAYARLRTANNLAVKVQRGGKPMDIDIQIK
jgi:general secretion pathway protein C